MKDAIVYASMTGHSRKIARAIGEALKVEPQDVKNDTTIKSVNTLFIVGGIYGNESMPEMMNYVKSLEKHQVRSVVFMTSRAGKSATQEKLRAILEEKGIKVEAEEFVCRGNFLIVGLGHPNKKEIQDAVTFAKKYSASKGLQTINSKKI